MRSERSLAESVTLGVCAVILGVVVALIVSQAPHEDEQPAPLATIEHVEQVGDGFHATVRVTNTGGQTASNVQVSAELVVAGERTGGDQTIDFLAPDDSATVAFVFANDPATGDLTVDVTSYAIP